ncbi:SRPBCC family protein [Marinilabiliaceae bacterium ANBcel2]|nr:SRPBCC family protein [Marinilabiliaceae bacterium ANBcel2]
MTKFEGPIKTVPQSPLVIYKFLTDFDNFKPLLPEDKISYWENSKESCRFEIEGIGEIGLTIVDKEENKTVKYSSDGKTPFNFFLWVQLKEISKNNSKIKLTIKADLNPMIKMMVSKHIERFLEEITSSIADYNFPNNEEIS